MKLTRAFGKIMTDEEARIVTSGKLGEAVGIIEGHEIYYDVSTIKAIASWHRERLEWCNRVIESEENEPQH